MSKFELGEGLERTIFGGLLRCVKLLVSYGYRNSHWEGVEHTLYHDSAGDSSIALKRGKMVRCKKAHHLFVQVHGRLSASLATMNVVQMMKRPGPQLEKSLCSSASSPHHPLKTCHAHVSMTNPF